MDFNILSIDDFDKQIVSIYSCDLSPDGSGLVKNFKGQASIKSAKGFFLIIASTF